MIHHLASPAFWVALGEIIMVNIVLSGDNAVVIALAARSLPRRQQKQAIIWGSVAATVILVVLTIIAAEIFELPYLRLVGSLLLFWIAVQLLIPGNTFHTARQIGRRQWFLGGSTEWPGVVPADVEIGNLDALAGKYPAVAAELRAIAASVEHVDASGAVPR